MVETLGYIRHFNLIAEPFNDGADPRFIWLGEKHLENLAHLKVGVEQAKGLLLLAGETGSGKSVLVDRLLKIVAADLRTAVLREPGIEVKRFFEFLAEAFGIDGEIATKGDFLIRFKAFLEMSSSRGVIVLLIVESAESQSDAVLEQIRLLSNIEGEGRKLLTVLLVGTGRLHAKLSTQKHRALQQRLAVRCKLEALTEAETRNYIRHRMMVAGAFLPVFTDEAVRLIHRFSGGLPKLVNLVCGHALMNACSEGRRTIDDEIVLRYMKTMRRSFGLERGAGLSALQNGNSTAQTGRPWKGGWFGRLAVMIFSLLCLLLIAGVALEVLKDKKTPAGGSLPAGLRLRFDGGSKEFDAETSAELRRIAVFLNQSPDLLLTVKGFSEEKTPPAETYRVSKGKAERVKDYLVGHGVDPDRVMALGQGPEPATARKSKAEEPDSIVEVEIEFSTGRSR